MVLLDDRSPRRARHRRSPAGDQRPAASPTDRSSPASTTLASDGIDGVRLLDLLRAFTRHPGDNRARERNPRRTVRSRLGLRLAGRPPHPLQPRVGEARRSPVERAQEAGLVGRATRSEWTGLDTPDFAQTKAAGLSAAARRDGRRSALPATRRSSCTPDGVGWIWVAKRPQGRTAAGALRAVRVAGQQPAVSAQQVNPAGRSKRSGRTIPTRVSRSATISVRAHDLSADRASHCRRHDADAPASRRAAAGALLRDLAGACGGTRHRSTASDVTITSPRGSIEARALVTRRMRPLQVDGRTVHQVGLPYHWGHRGSRDAATSSTIWSRSRKSRTSRSWNRRAAGVCRADDRRRDRVTQDSHGAQPVVIEQARTLRVDGSRGFFTDSDAVHRLQSLRSRLQGMEPGPERRLRTGPGSRTTTPPASAIRPGAT